MPAFLLTAWKWLGVKGAEIIGGILLVGAILLRVRSDGEKAATTKIVAKEQKDDAQATKKADDASQGVRNHVSPGGVVDPTIVREHDEFERPGGV